MTNYSRYFGIKPVLTLLALVLSLTVLAGCSSPSDSGGSDKAKVVNEAEEAEEFDGHVVLDTYTLELDVPSFKAGHVMFEIRNNADMKHELAIYKTELSADALPMNTKLNKVDSQGKGIEKIGEVVVEPGTVAHWGEELLPGRYVAICNFPGHFDHGMVTIFEVR